MAQTREDEPYAKLLCSILDSSVWQESDQTVRVWVALMAMADKDGNVWASIPGLACRARVPLQACETALSIFQSPDPYSRNPDNDGRRLEEIRGGWRLLNHKAIRGTRDPNVRDEQKKAAQARWKAKQREKAKGDQGRSEEIKGDQNPPYTDPSPSPDPLTTTTLSGKSPTTPSPKKSPKKPPTYNQEAIDLWLERYDRKTLPWGEPDHKALKTAHARDPDGFLPAWMAYLADEDPFYEGHSPRKFISDLSKWLARGKPKREMSMLDRFKKDGLKMVRDG